MFRRNKKEDVNKAISTAQEAIDHLENARKFLNGASRWGVFELFKSGLITTTIKHGRIENAQEELRAAKETVDVFAEEVKGLKGIKKPKINVGGLVTFADFISSHAVVDFIVLYKVSRTKKQAKKASKQIKQYQKELKVLEKKAK